MNSARNTLIHIWKYLRAQKSIFSPVSEQHDINDAMAIVGARIVALDSEVSQ